LKNKSKITIIIIFQIGLIFASFLAIAILESNRGYLGNAVNIAGKNRFLASQFVDEVKDSEFVKNPDANPELKLKILEENIDLLKVGGIKDGIQLNELDIQFQDDWVKVKNDFIGLKSEYLKIKDITSNNLTFETLIPLDEKFSRFIDSSDNLVQKLGFNIEIISKRTLYFEIILLVVNVLVHILLILMIIGIYKLEFKKNLKLEKLAAIGELSSRIAHDMRNPLSNINMSIQLLKSKNESYSETEKLELIEKSVERLTHQIRDVLNFVRTKDPNFILWSLNEIILSALEKISVPKFITVDLPKKNLYLKCDREQFEILFINLLSNSIDAIEAKGTIKIDAEENPKEITIILTDSGSGIPEDYINIIFEPLVTLKEKGTGLGLASCKNIVEGHKGSISVKNNPTTFTIKIPKVNQHIS